MLGWGGGRALLPGMLSVVLRKQPSGFARPPSLIAEVLGRRTSPTLRKPAGTYLKMADPWQECMDYAVTLARRAGEMIREALQNEVNVMIKSSPADLVTVTDQNVEKMLLSSIKEKYPSHSFIGEESVAAGEKTVFTDKPTWIIDPIDGTTNFVHRFPFVAVSIGFVVNKQMEFGVVYSCVEDKMYTGRKGKGAFCNGQKLRVSQQEDITKALLVTELGSSRKPETLRIVLSNMEKLCSLPIHGCLSKNYHLKSHCHKTWSSVPVTLASTKLRQEDCRESFKGS